MDSELNYALRSLNTRVVYIPNNGNAGDSFIAHATYQLFARVGLDYEIGNVYGIYRDRVIICGGGGNLVSHYHDMIDFLKLNLNQWRELIILPHSIRDYEDTLGQLGSNSLIFCRERPSFDFMRKTAPRANVLLSDDVALSCDFVETERQMRGRIFSDLRDRQLAVQNAKRLVRALKYYAMNLRTPMTLNAIRGDVEKTALIVPFPNIDLSQAFRANDFLPLSSLHATYWLMQFVRGFTTIRTNRLHIAIMAAMLGKHVRFYDNSYGKNRSVFDLSLRGKFDNVDWVD
jgi:exopolysaccharide biosynthesis predicted pyruvyltransferase EpsI